jgi:cytochrome c peroxidase
MHNGVFTTLEEVVDFYNERNVADAEVNRNLVMIDGGDLNFSDQ